ncbi:MAG: MBL fold metallo-hydrolase [Fimbriimonadaceae bacterium]|nr:MBL fold metallo-hydrolase [Alphaproteobacteria bacterium]
MPVDLTFIGCGDAFGTGGRFNTCFFVRADACAFLIDCGASSMIALRQNKIDPNEIAVILISHLHGDHFGGLPFFLLDAHLVSKRTNPLVIAGPPGLRDRLQRTMEALFANSSNIPWRFDLEIVELPAGIASNVGAVRVTPFEVVHGSGAPPYALRVEVEDRIVSYSCDTQWTDALVAAAHDADIFICECYMFDTEVKFHLNYRKIMAHFDELAAKQLILTHMSEEMLSRLGEVDRTKAVPAQDGMVISL